MNIYLLKRKDHHYYDEFDSFVCAAKNQLDAISIHPSGRQEGTCIQKEDLKRVDGWTWTENIDVKLIGKATKDVKRGVICASFNAG